MIVQKSFDEGTQDFLYAVVCTFIVYLINWKSNFNFSWHFSGHHFWLTLLRHSFDFQVHISWPLLISVSQFSDFCWPVFMDFLTLQIINFI